MAVTNLLLLPFFFPQIFSVVITCSIYLTSHKVAKNDNCLFLTLVINFLCVLTSFQTCILLILAIQVMFSNLFAKPYLWASRFFWELLHKSVTVIKSKTYMKTMLAYAVTKNKLIKQHVSSPALVLRLFDELILID